MTNINLAAKISLFTPQSLCLFVNVMQYPVHCILIISSVTRKQRRPPAGENLHRAGPARIQAGLPHVWEKPGTFTHSHIHRRLRWDHADKNMQSLFFLFFFLTSCRAICRALTAVLFFAVSPCRLTRLQISTPWRTGCWMRSFSISNCTISLLAG